MEFHQEVSGAAFVFGQHLNNCSAEWNKSRSKQKQFQSLREMDRKHMFPSSFLFLNTLVNLGCRPKWCLPSWMELPWSQLSHDPMIQTATPGPRAQGSLLGEASSWSSSGHNGAVVPGRLACQHDESKAWEKMVIQVWSVEEHPTTHQKHEI